MPPVRPQPPRVITEVPPPSQLDLEWSPLLTRMNERIIKLDKLVVTKNKGPHVPEPVGEQAGTPKKFSRFFGGGGPKRRSRLVMVTSSARVVIATLGGSKESKGEMSLLNPKAQVKSFQDSKGVTAWCVDLVRDPDQVHLRVELTYFRAISMSSSKIRPRTPKSQKAADSTLKNGSMLASRPEIWHSHSPFKTHTPAIPL